MNEVHSFKLPAENVKFLLCEQFEHKEIFLIKQPIETKTNKQKGGEFITNFNKQKQKNWNLYPKR